MPIGDSYSRISRNKLSALAIRCLGALDLHTHIRLKPLLSFFRSHTQAGARCRVLEIGCGDGVNAFELLKLARQKGVALHYRGVDIAPQHLQKARQLAQTLDIEGHLEFLQMTAEDIGSRPTEPPDIVILADILEHVRDPEMLLKDLRPILHNHSVCLVSVPTRNYERVFGTSFHTKVGHLRSGYDLEELNALFAPIGGRMICHRYSTGLVSNLGCALYYRIPDSRWATALKALALSPFRFLDFYNSPTVSCSLFAAYSFDHRLNRGAG